MEPSLVRFADALPSAPQSLWAEAGCDSVAWGASLDRLFGAPDDGHLLEHFAPAADVIVPFDDSLVLLASFIDGVSLPTAEPMPLPMAELAAVYDFSAGADGLHLHDVWTFDSHA